ncbi:MAG: hypothetical protein QG620_573 [Patescibacteria group bacterium]|nr:hypothetical protein [Patescibacteria group bacterium]
MITESDARTFQILYEKETGEKISLEEAFEIAESTVEMVRFIFKPIKRKDSDQCTRGASDIK